LERSYAPDRSQGGGRLPSPLVRTWLVGGGRWIVAADCPLSPADSQHRSPGCARPIQRVR
jgi:hypothetical protein